MKKKLKLRREVVVNLAQLAGVVGGASENTFCESECIRCSLLSCRQCPTEGCTNPCQTIQRCTFGTC